MHSFPILVEVVNEIKKGIVPFSIIKNFRQQIGRSPFITDSGGRIFPLRFIQSFNTGLFTKGWSSFVDTFNLENNDKVFLKYFGNSSFTFDEEDQEVKPNVQLLQRTQKPSSQTKCRGEIGRSSRLSISSGMMCQITLTPYTATKNHLNLPGSFVKSSLNLRLKNVILEVNANRQWKCGLYHDDSRPKEARISTGWKVCCCELNLKAGDLITFKVINRMKNHIIAHVERC